MKKINLKSTLLWAAALISTVWIFLLSLTPVIDRDATKLHMAFPAIWKDQNFLFFHKFNAAHELSMFNLDYIYMLLLKFFEYEQLPKIFHASLLVLSGIVIFRFVKEKYSLNFALLAYIITLTIPINQRLSSEVYVDLGVLFFTAVSMVGFIKWIESDFTKNKYFFITAISAGLCAGTKYNAYIYIAVLVLIMTYAHSKYKSNNIKPLVYASVFAAIVIVLISPWLVRNYLGSGNPFHPLFKSLFGTTLMAPEILFPDPDTASELAWRKMEGEGFFSIIFIPVKVFFTGIDHDFLHFDGILNPFLFILLFFTGLKTDLKKQIIDRKIIRLLFSIFILTLFLTVFYNRVRIRYFISILPFMILINMDSLYKLYYKFRAYSGILKKLSIVLFYCIIVSLLSYNVKYGIRLFSRLDTADYLFGNETKEQYLSKKLSMYKIYKFINENTEKNAAVYDVLCGNRYYYIDRKFLCDEPTIDRWFFNITQKEQGPKAYLDFLSNVPNSDGIKVDYLMIRPKGFMTTFRDVFSDEGTKALDRKLTHFVNFINSQKMVYRGDGVVIYKLIYDE